MIRLLAYRLVSRARHYLCAWEIKLNPAKQTPRFDDRMWDAPHWWDIC
jgi:hypothetical protein